MDADKLISLIHGEPSLWDKQSSDYADNTARSRSWVAVGKGLFDDFETLAGQEKSRKITEMKDKWRHIRDNYVRYMNGGNSGDAATKKRKYMYADALEFLRNSVEKRRTSGNFEQQSDSISVDDPLTEDTNVEEDYVESQGTAPSTSHFSGTTPPPPTAPRKKTPKRIVTATTPFQSALLEKIDAPITFTAEPEDPDKAYLFSLLPSYKKLTDEDKLDFQSTIINFLRSRMRRGATPYPPIQPSFNQTPFKQTPFFQEYNFAPQTHMNPRACSSTSSSSSVSHSSDFTTMNE